MVGRILAGLAALAQPAAALHSMSPKQSPVQVPPGAAQAAKSRFCIDGAYRQELSNLGDMQYHGTLQIGGQTIEGIIDTGSFEIVVFSGSCRSCGIAGRYMEEKSTHFKPGNVTTVHSYGSGSCESSDGWDEVDMVCFGERSQSLWVAKKCDMPALQAASFNAIVGVGPPGQPEYTARAELDSLLQMEDEMTKQGRPLPPTIQQAKAKLQAMLDDALRKPAMLQNFQINTFSHCLGRAPGSPGWMIWNDKTHEGSPGVKKIPVAGNITWGISIDSIGFQTPDGLVEFGCRGGCGGIVDSGTSLVALPTSSYKNAVQYLTSSAPASDCSDLSKFPDMVVTLNGDRFHLPPSAYLGVVEGEISTQAKMYMHRGALSGNPDGVAQPPHEEEAGPPKSAAEAMERAKVNVAAREAAEAAATAGAAAQAAGESATEAAVAAQAASKAAQVAARAAAAAAAIAAGEPVPPESEPEEEPRQRKQPTGPACELLLMDIGEQSTVLGPMAILGMPFFRHFYTTFDLGKGRGDRSLFVSQASEDCHPVTTESPVVQTARRHAEVAPRHIDASKIRAPHWLNKLPKGEI